MLAAVLIVIIVLLLLFNFPKKPKNFPPGPYIFPIVGVFPHLTLYDCDPSKIGPYLKKNWGGLNGLVFPFYTTVQVSSWEAMKELYTNEDCQGRPDVVLIRDRFEGGNNFGVLFTDGENHKQQRKFIMQNFRHIGFGKRSHEGLIHEEAMELVKDIADTKEEPFEIEKLFYLTNINITWTLLSSRKYKHNDPKLINLAAGINMVIHDVGIHGSIGNLLPILRYIFPEYTGYTSVIKGGALIREAAKEQIEEHKRTLDPDDPRDFLDSYLIKAKSEKENPNTHFTEDELMGVCMDFLLAGADTSTGTMTFTILFLAIHKEQQEKAYRELMEVVGPNELPSLDDRNKLVYCEAFMCEVFRYRAIAPIYPPHRVMRDTVFGGFNVPKDTIIFPDIHMILNDPEVYGDPENFRPERYISEEGKIIRDERLLPFGKGKRSCLGEPLARMSSFLIFITLLYHFEFSLPPGEEDVDTRGTQGFTLTPPKFRVIAKPRIPMDKPEYKRSDSY